MRQLINKSFIAALSFLFVAAFSPITNAAENPFGMRLKKASAAKANVVATRKRLKKASAAKANVVATRKRLKKASVAKANVAATRKRLNKVSVMANKHHFS